jgi:putative phosphoesterase
MDNKKLLVLSDSHGGVSALKSIFLWVKEHTPPNDTICGAIFLGDGISDLKPAVDATALEISWAFVNGNNDYDFSFPQATAFDFGGHCFFACHGHRHSLYGGYHTLIAAAKNAKADVALFGHSHVPFYKKIDGLSLINPGSVARPRSKTGATFAVINCQENNSITVEFYGIGSKGEIRAGIKPLSK